MHLQFELMADNKGGRRQVDDNADDLPMGDSWVMDQTMVA